MTERSPDRRPAPLGDEAGMVMILFAGFLIALLGVAALLVDLGQQRVSRRSAQSIADIAALGGGKNLSRSNIGQACQDVVTYFDENAPNLPSALSASTFCNQAAPVNVAATECSGGTGQARPSATVGRYTIQLEYPVYDSEIADSHFSGAGNHDGIPCDRMLVRITVTNPTYFGRLFGASTISTTRTAVVKKLLPGPQIPALWLLDPTGCVSLAASGGAQLIVGDTSSPNPSQWVPGLVTIDSDGTNCTGSQTTISSTGSGTLVSTVPTSGSNPGAISLFALPPRATTCSNRACAQADVTAGNISPQPTPVAERATRAPVDWRYNCKSSPGLLNYAYPAFHGIQIPDCDGTSPPYVDQLIATVGASGAPAGFATTTNCSPSGNVTFPGNTWVNCSTFTVQNGTNVLFTGNVIFQGNVKLTGGSLTVTPGSGTLSPTCMTGITAGCIGSYSPNAAFIYQRSGDVSATGGGAITFNHTFLYQAHGVISDGGGAAPVWSPPLEGPFYKLSLWSEGVTGNNSGFTINGGGGLDLAGVFFTPEAAPFKINGGGGVAQQHAQFIAFQLLISGSGQLIMAPDAGDVPIPPKRGLLIR